MEASMNEPITYSSSPAALFACVARDVPAKQASQTHVCDMPDAGLKPALAITLFCQQCCRDTEQELVDEQGIYEVYECPVCGCSRSYAVR
jgi:hypothetical protein